MGWKGNIRSFNASMKRIDRESKRRQKELDKRLKEREKMEVLEQAKYDVEVYENYIEQLQSLHKDGSNKIDWYELKNEEEPLEPSLTYPKKEEAEQNFENFKPNFFHKLFKLSESKKQSLFDNIEIAKRTDEYNYEQNQIHYQQEYNDWIEQITLADKIINNDEKAILQVIEDINPFLEISNLGSSVKFYFDRGYLNVDLNVHSENIIPNEKNVY